MVNKYTVDHWLKIYNEGRTAHKNYKIKEDKMPDNPYEVVNGDQLAMSMWDLGWRHEVELFGELMRWKLV